MKDTIIKGSGMSRSIFMPPNAPTLFPDWESFVRACSTEGVPIDIGPLNPLGCEVVGTQLIKGTLLSDENAAAFGLDEDATPNDMWTKMTANMGEIVGEIVFFARSTAPEGYLFCNGATIASVDYPRLFDVIGTMFGGDSINFKLPDLRNQFIRGISSGLSPTTNLGAKYGATSIPYANGNAAPSVSAGNADSSSSGSQALVVHTGNAITNFNVKIATVRPANMGLLPCIKY